MNLKINSRTSHLDSDMYITGKLTSLTSLINHAEVKTDGWTDSVHRHLSIISSFFHSMVKRNVELEVSLMFVSSPEKAAGFANTPSSKRAVSL